MTTRRSFLSTAAMTPFVIGAAPKTAPVVTLVMDGNDPVTAARPVAMAAHSLQQELTKAGFSVKRAQTAAQAGGLVIMAAGSTSPAAAGALAAARVAQPMEPESLALFETKLSGVTAVVACSPDSRGLTYALLDLTDRVRAKTPLKFAQPVVEKPANRVRSVMRQFVSELYDKPWFYDRAMWPQYLSMLATHRFNRFQLAFGLGEDTLRHVRDQYFLFTYPFLVAVPGYDVKVTNLSDAERAKNLQMLRYISDQTAATGLDFELGLWMHGYEWKDTPDPKYTIAGLTPANHAAYCRDALTELLKALPAVSSVALRIHGESGIAEGSYDFWKTIFDGVAKAGRKIEIDLHAKGIDDKMLANALATAMPVNVSPKFTAEHLGLPYHPADIRPTEIPSATSVGQGLMALSEGQRSFTRYGYADLMRDDRKYTVRTRVFSGTQRLLASGNLAAGAAYGKAFQFSGMTGGEWMEPLTCRGRRGSAVEGIARSGYALTKLEPLYDWQKFDAWYRCYGRGLYNPETGAEVALRGPGKNSALEDALAAASRILPLVTSAYMPSAACDAYWPEMYWNQPLSGEPNPNVYSDMPAPKVFQNTDALDPQMFLSCRGYAEEVFTERSGKYSPLEVATWLEGFAGAAEAGLKTAGEPNSVEAARLAFDIEIQARLGRFFAEKLRSGVLFALHEKTNDTAALHESLAHYEEARRQWMALVERARGVYASDLGASDKLSERGQWRDMLPLIEWDITECERRRASAKPATDPRLAAAVKAAGEPAPKRFLPASHTPPAAFTPGQPVDLLIAVREGLSSARLWYRHVNNAERWTAAAMDGAYEGWKASIPAAYTDSPYPLQYYFEFRAAPDRAWIHPGFDENLLNQPYVVLRRT